MDNLNIVTIDSRGEAGFISGHGFFHLFSRLGVALLARLEAGAPHPLIEGAWPSPERLPKYVEPMLLEHAEEAGEAKRGEEVWEGSRSLSI
jgi:hypothetical protein